MAYNEELAQRVRDVLAPLDNVHEQKMFGGLAFMLNGNMCCCVDRDNLVVRTGPQTYDDALGRPHARVFDFTGRPMRGFVYVEGAGLKGEDDLREWVNWAVAFAGSLPAKRKKR